MFIIARNSSRDGRLPGSPHDDGEQKWNGPEIAFENGLLTKDSFQVQDIHHIMKLPLSQQDLALNSGVIYLFCNTDNLKLLSEKLRKENPSMTKGFIL